MITYKFKLYRNEKNSILTSKIDIAGMVYNHCIALHRRYYRLTGKCLNCNRLKVHLTKRKKLAKYEETLNLRGIVKLWGRKVSDLAFASFLDILKYVAAKKGKTVHGIDRWYPSTKTCSCCGHINHNLTLNDRRWRCPSCNQVVDTDTNAALNLLGEGTSSLAVGAVRPALQASAV